MRCSDTARRHYRSWWPRPRRAANARGLDAPAEDYNGS